LEEWRRASPECSREQRAEEGKRIAEMQSRCNQLAVEKEVLFGEEHVTIMILLYHHHDWSLWTMPMDSFSLTPGGPRIRYESLERQL